MSERVEKIVESTALLDGRADEVVMLSLSLPFAVVDVTEASEVETGSELICSLALATLNGYVTLLAQALEIAAMKKVADGGGFSLFERGNRRRLKVSKRKKVSEGLRARTRAAE